MASLNKVMQIGRLTRDPEEPRVLPNSGTTVVKFRLAVGRSRKNPQTGQYENDPNPLYIDCEVFSRADAKRNLCDVVTRYVRQGDQIYVEGRLQLDEWEDKNGGGKRSKHKIVVDSIEMLGGGGGKASSADDGADCAGSEDGGGEDAAPQKQLPASKPAAAGKKGGGRKAAAPRGGSFPADDDMGGNGPDADIPF